MKRLDKREEQTVEMFALTLDLLIKTEHEFWAQVRLGKISDEDREKAIAGFNQIKSDTLNRSRGRELLQLVLERSPEEGSRWKLCKELLAQESLGEAITTPASVGLERFKNLIHRKLR